MLVIAAVTRLLVLHLLGAIALLGSATIDAQTVINSTFTAAVSTNYSDPNNWSPREVPNNTPTRNYNVSVPGRVRVDMNVRISNLNANGIVIPGGASVTVVESATVGTLPTPDPSGFIQSGLTLLQGGLFAVEGTLTNFDASTRTLKGGTFYLSGVPQAGGGVSTLRFSGADIVHNASSIDLVGSAVQIVDENGLDALRNLASNTAEGVFRVSQRDFTITGAFTNGGLLSIGLGTLTLAGPLTNYDAASRTLRGGTYVISSSGAFQFPNADILRNAASIYVAGGAMTDRNGNNALRNLAFNDAGALLLAPNAFTTAGTFTNAGEMIIAPATGGGGVFTIARGHRYVQTAGRTVLSSAVFTGDMEINGGELTASSTFFAGTARVNGNLTVGDALLVPRELQVNGSVHLGANTRMRIVPRGEGSLNQLQALLMVDGPVAVAGSIQIDDASEFPEGSNFVFQAIFSRSVTGNFSNAPNGSRVTTTSGRGSYLVAYQNDSVLIGGYQRIPPAAQLLNISTRARVGTGNNVTIGGFIISGFLGNEPRRIAVRGLGPSLSKSSVDGVLQDPVIELHDSRGNLLATNDNWKDAQPDDLRASGLAPEDDREAALIATLPRGAYTVVLRGANGTEGTGLVEAYDLVRDAKSRLANISTRGFVDPENPLIGGYISGGDGPGNAELTVRAIGPSLRHRGFSNFLPDPPLEVRDSNGSLVAANDDHGNPSANWQTILPGLSPFERLDAATGMNLPRGEYTVIVRGKGDASGIALVEIYDHNR
ncbi:MAG TPA: hypothetical protein VK993_00535 [Chthoniobacterales bacterium]|nr:hypothetical protein [Chthoniobacterales bacterium]